MGRRPKNRCAGRRLDAVAVFARAWVLVAVVGFVMPATTSATKPLVTIPADTLHGYVIADPYRWLEDFRSERAQAWIEEQTSRTREILDSVPGRDSIRERLSELLDIPSIGMLAHHEGRLFFTKREGDQEQSVLYVQRAPDAEPEELIDPEKLGGETPVTLDWWYPSRDGRLLAYGTSESGSELSTLHVLDVDSRETLSDEIPWTRSASLAWEPDASAFYYTRFPAPGEVPEGEEYYHRKVYRHALGTRCQDDPLVFGDGLDMRVWTGVSLSTDGRFLLGYAFHGSARNDLYVRDLETDGEWTAIAEGMDARFTGTAVGGDLYMMTSYGAANGRVVKVDLERPRPENWVELIPESTRTIRGLMYVGGRLLVHYLENAHSTVAVYSTAGEHVADVQLPEFSSVYDWTGDWQGTEAFIAVSSFLIPPTVYHYDVETGELSTAMAVEAPIDTSPYVTEQVWYESRDGTPISMFLVHRKDIRLDGDNPTILTGYGGFSVSVTPAFARNRYLWLEHGGVFAIPNLRGGGEYGEAWHRAGMLDTKQHTFDDFIAAAEWLIKHGYTSPSRLAVWGGSNGGLLVGAFITQRPDLARAAICDVPLLDMTRFHLFYGASIWTAEYGSPEDPDEFEILYAYSPYQHVVDEVSYPAVYFTCGESDTRVHPSHALKMAARLMEATSSGRPILLRYERQAGHGMGVRMSTVLDEYVDYYSFLFRELGVDQ